MTCCSGRRAALNRGTGLRSMPQQAAATMASAETVVLTYRGPVPMALPSPSGAAPYTLQAVGQALSVDARDATALLLTGWFTRS